MSHFTVEGARRRLAEAAIDVRWARSKNAAFPTEATKRLLESAVLDWTRAHATLKNAAVTFGTSADQEAAAREIPPE
jgi:hypothetical protein